MSQVVLEKLQDYKDAGDNLAAVNRRAEEIPIAIGDASVREEQARQQLAQEVVKHPELSDAAKAGWLTAIYALGYAWKEYSELSLEDKASLFADKLETVVDKLQPGTPVLYTTSQFRLDAQFSARPEDRKRLLPATNFFRLGTLGDDGLQFELTTDIPKATVDMEHSSTPSTLASSGFNSWELHIHTWISKSTTSTDEIVGIEPSELFQNQSGGEYPRVIIGLDSLATYMNSMLQYRDQLAAEETDSNRAYIGYLDEVFLTLWQEARELGINLEAESEKIATEIERQKQEIISKRASELSYQLYQHHHITGGKIELSLREGLLGIEPGDIRESTLTRLEERFEETRSELAETPFSQMSRISTEESIR